MLATITARFPAARIVVAETLVQGPSAAVAMIDALRDVCAVDGVRRRRLARGGGSFDDLLPFSDERLVRVVAPPALFRSCPPSATSRTLRSATLQPMPGPRRQRQRHGSSCRTRRRFSAVSTTRAAGSHAGRADCFDRRRQQLHHAHHRLQRAPAVAVERKRARLEHAAGGLRTLSPRATLERGYAIVRTGDAIVRSRQAVKTGDELAVEVADGRFGARVE